MTKTDSGKFNYDEETQAVLRWLLKHHLAACWVVQKGTNLSRFEIKRAGVAVLSDETFSVEERSNLTYYDMKGMIMEMYERLKEKENEK